MTSQCYCARAETMRAFLGAERWSGVHVRAYTLGVPVTETHLRQRPTRIDP